MSQTSRIRHRFDLLADTVLNQQEVSSFGPYPDRSMRVDYLNELRNFVVNNPRRAASMSTEIEMRLEREYIRNALPKWNNSEAVTTIVNRIDRCASEYVLTI
ncbi:hypothetical protein PENTCL1PPCAC_8076 [Pristionchus entomophagus]|uniref:Uncharacterized protein n=1 Tax=Pristionchus entomophagus TaxID=358040 RepID=A0AAV5SR98_9BILA|nr:hypothetical protein PENTCL1PPCAC_8076 [Pristionchus entomophagus]